MVRHDRKRDPLCADCEAFVAERLPAIIGSSRSSLCTQLTTPEAVPHIQVTRTARYETLGGDGDAVGEVWFVLHGYGQLAQSFLRAFEVLTDPTRLIVAPEALNRFYLVGVDTAPAAERPVGATWMTREDRDCEITDYVAYLDAVADRVLSDVRRAGNSPRIVLLGFSQGTATAARWLTFGQLRPDHLVLWGGLLPPDIDLASAALRVRSVYHIVGTRDRFVSKDRVVAERERVLAGGLASRFLEYEGGHSIRGDMLVELARDLERLRDT